jgi:hypothetical protein
VWLAGFDPGAGRVHGALALRVLETGDPGVARMWAVPVAQGLGPDEVIESMKGLAAPRRGLCWPLSLSLSLSLS